MFVLFGVGSGGSLFWLRFNSSRVFLVMVGGERELFVLFGFFRVRRFF